MRIFPVICPITHPVNTPCQYTLSIHPINTPCQYWQYTLSIHPVCIHPVCVHPVTKSCQTTLSIHFIYSMNHFIYSMNHFIYSMNHFIYSIFHFIYSMGRQLWSDNDLYTSNTFSHTLSHPLASFTLALITPSYPIKLSTLTIPSCTLFIPFFTSFILFFTLFIPGGNNPGQIMMPAGSCHNFTIVSRDVSGTMRGAGGDSFEVTPPLKTYPLNTFYGTDTDTQ